MIDKYLDMARKQKKTWNIVVTMIISIVVGALEMLSKGLEKKKKKLDIRKNWDHPDHSIIKIN